MADPTKNKSCSAVVIFVVLGVLALLAIPVLIFGMYFMERTSVSEKHYSQADLAQSTMIEPKSNDDKYEVHLKEGFRPRSIAEIGDELDRETFVDFIIDSDATTLSQKAFIKKAHGRRVRWLMRVRDIKEAADGGLSGDFDLIYKIHSENGYSGAGVLIYVSFPASEEGALTKLCRNDWVTIEGRLEFENVYPYSLREAKVVEVKK
jgi:hypothetical protein